VFLSGDRGACRWAGNCGRVEGELAEQFAGGGVDDADVQVADEQQDAGSGVGAADADVVELAGVAEADFAVGVDAVGADAVVGVGGAALTTSDFGPSKTRRAASSSRVRLSQGGSADSNPVGATEVAAGHGPDRRSRRSGP
jgi:hypothetical protein